MSGTKETGPRREDGGRLTQQIGIGALAMSHPSINHDSPADQQQSDPMSTGSFIGWTILLASTLISAILLGALSVGML
ncbi:hypothetical protein SEA_ALLEYCAT_45 [Mycobacterium phage AlleyCat]|uniref:Uncharacterized protein n=4 Tax=Kratiovirus larva TaxID=1056831 RepID=A0A221J783_9CAUD|nr:hypothetical protein SEA_ALLEYCAT_45 [Mycobacterium phage AlleyCat]WAB09726.1 membrane protein [Mycobacterium phage Dadosky]